MTVGSLFSAPSAQKLKDSTFHAFGTVMSVCRTSFGMPCALSTRSWLTLSPFRRALRGCGPGASACEQQGPDGLITRFGDCPWCCSRSHLFVCARQQLREQLRMDGERQMRQLIAAIVPPNEYRMVHAGSGSLMLQSELRKLNFAMHQRRHIIQQCKNRYATHLLSL